MERGTIDHIPPNDFFVKSKTWYVVHIFRIILKRLLKEVVFVVMIYFCLVKQISSNILSYRGQLGTKLNLTGGLQKLILRLASYIMGGHNVIYLYLCLNIFFSISLFLMSKMVSGTWRPLQADSGGWSGTDEEVIH